MKRRTLLEAAALSPLILRRAHAQALDTVRIGVLTDETSLYSDSGGAGSVLAAQMAVADFGGSVRGAKIEIVHGDTQNKPDVAASVARRWYDEQGVDAITDLPVTPIALAVQTLAKEKKKTVMITASAISEFTAKFCSPVSTHWADDTHALTTGTAKAVVQRGGKSWYFITVNMQFGWDLQGAATSVIAANGGTVIGSTKFPIGASDFSSQLLQAQSSGAQVIGLAAVGGDLVNLLKQASEFGIHGGGKQELAGFLIYINDINALGLKVAQGFEFSAGFYWDQNDAARAFAKRFFAERKAMPSKNQAEIYTAVLHYIRAIERAGTKDPIAVNQAMRAMPVDYFGHQATVRADGRVLYEVAQYRVKSPEESRAPWDYYEQIGSIPPDQAFLPMSPSCAA